MEYTVDCSKKVLQLDCLSEIALFDYFMDYMHAKEIVPTSTLILEVETMFPEILIPLEERISRMQALVKEDKSSLILGYIIILKTGEVFDTLWDEPTPFTNTVRWHNSQEKVKIENLEDVAEVLFWRNMTVGWGPKSEQKYRDLLKRL